MVCDIAHKASKDMFETFNLQQGISEISNPLLDTDRSSTAEQKDHFTFQHDITRSHFMTVMALKNLGYKCSETFKRIKHTRNKVGSGTATWT